jgi:hypothetical protein
MTTDEKVDQLVACVTLLNQALSLMTQQCVMEARKVRLLEEKVESLEARLFIAKELK